MKRQIVGLYGVGGCGRGIMPLLRTQFPCANLMFVDDFATSPVNHINVVNWKQFLCEETDDKYICIGIANSHIRERLVAKCDECGIPLVEARASNVVQMDDVVIGDGACLSPFVTLTSNIRIGRCFHANLYSYVEHDCVIGDFVTLAPGAKINGNVKIGDHAYIGAGAVIRQGLSVGAAAVVGMGAVVTKNVPPGATVVGNPAKPLVKA